jgi:hypothetical protein
LQATHPDGQATGVGRAVCTVRIVAGRNVNDGDIVPKVIGALKEVGTGTGAVVFFAVTKTGTVVIVFTAVCTGSGVVVLSFTGVVIAVAMLLFTGACVWTCRPAAAPREQQKKRTRRRTSTVFFRLLYGLSGGRTGCGSIGRAPDDKQLAWDAIILSASLRDIQRGIPAMTMSGKKKQLYLRIQFHTDAVFCTEYLVIHECEDSAADDPADNTIGNHQAKTEEAGLDQGSIPVRHIPLDITGEEYESCQESPDKTNEGKELRDTQHPELFYRIIRYFCHRFRLSREMKRLPVIVFYAFTVCYGTNFKPG